LSTIARILSAMVVAAFAVGPVSVAAAPNASPSVVAQNASSAQAGTVSGTVVDAAGSPVSGVTVTLRGSQTYTATSDSKGAFSIANVTPGVYTLTAARAGYETATENDYAVVSGQNGAVAVTLSVASFTSLRTIATVRSTGRGTFNTSTAAVNTVSAQDFANQGSPQVTRILDQVPGVQISYPSGSGNAAVPGAITFPNIRNALSYETASLIDGHPLSVGRFGDYVTSFLNSYMLQQAEVIKGPGANAPQTNYAIGGTVNFRTKDPTQALTPDYSFGYTNFGGTFFNFGLSGTIADGKLGFVADVASVNEPSALNGQSEYVGQLNGAVAHINGTTDVWSYNDLQSGVPGAPNAGLYNSYSLKVCCYAISGNFFNLSELLKLRYKFSSATTATVSYLGGQTTADQNGNTSQLTPTSFQPPAGYSGSTPVGYQFLTASAYPGGDIETNNEPILQAEVSSTLGSDTILARYYHASIYRLLVEGSNSPSVPNTLLQTVSGVNEGANGGAVYNDVTVPVDYYDYFRQDEIDKLGGTDLQYSHPYGEGGNITLSWSNTISQTQYFTQGTAITVNPDNSFGGAALAPPTVSIPTGSSETFQTLRLSDTQNFGEKFNGMLSLYDNSYKWTAAQACGSPCDPGGSNATFATTSLNHFDGRLGLTYRPEANLILRGALGSSIAPPYLNLVSKFNGGVTYNGYGAYATESLNNPNLKPETSFGWDVGADARIKGSYYVSGDIYLTNLFNQYDPYTELSNQLCTPAVNKSCPVAGIPILYQLNGNVSNSRYEGIELSLKRVVTDGFGFVLSGSTQRGYAYNLPANFYCSGKQAVCTPANYDINLNVVSGVNFNTSSSSAYYHTGACANQTNPQSSSYWCGATSLWNQSVPYLQGYGEINWQNPRGWYASFGGTLFGKNNSFSEPPFIEARASVRAPITSTLSLQISGNNIFNAYKQLFPIVGGGVSIPLATGGIGITNANVLGPAQYNFILTKTFGAFTSSDTGNSQR